MSGMGAGIVILAIILVMTFAQVSLLVLRSRERYDALMKKLEEIEGKLVR